MKVLTEAGKAHVIKSLDLKFEPNQYVSAEEMPEHKLNVYTAWYKHVETKLNRLNHNTIPIGLGYITLTEGMVQSVQ